MKGKRNKPGTGKSQERLSPFFPRATAPKAFFSPATLQPQLTIGQPGDRYEQEADAMGDRVARMSDTPRPAVQKQCADCEQKEALRRQAMPEEEKREEEPTVQAKRELRRQPEKDKEEEPVQTKPDLRRQPEKEEEEPLQTKPELRRAGEEAGQANLQRQGEEEKREDEPLQTKPLMRKSEAGPSVATPELTNRLNQSKGGGRALPANTQRFMGQAFDADFSGVRVHTDERAAEMNRGLQAKAFTHGGDIYFNRGQYQPDTTEGRRLLGHELTHVVQQGNGRIRRKKAGKGKSKSSTKQIQEPGPSPSESEYKKGYSSTPQKLRVNEPTSPGWATKPGDEVEIPHFLKVGLEDFDEKTNMATVVIMEGKFLFEKADIPPKSLTPAESLNPKPEAKLNFKIRLLDKDKINKKDAGGHLVFDAKFWHGSEEPSEYNAITSANNPVPQGNHPIEIPDYEHPIASRYGDYATTWFKIGHKGDRYIHPGKVTLGCATIVNISEWPEIWNSIITARRSGDVWIVGTMNVVHEKGE